MHLLGCTILFFFPGGFCIGAMMQGTGAGHRFHLRPVVLLVVCTGVAPPAPAHKRRLELKLLPGSLLNRHTFPSNIHYFKCGRKVYFGFPRNMRAEFGLVFPVMGSCVFLFEGRRCFHLFFLMVFLPLFPFGSLMVSLCCVPVHLFL